MQENDIHMHSQFRFNSMMQGLVIGLAIVANIISAALAGIFRLRNTIITVKN